MVGQHKERNNMEKKSDQLYQTAYTEHYSGKNLRNAIKLYQDVITIHPNSPESGYAQTQIQNIAKEVVPKQTLLEKQIELVLTHLPTES